IGSANLLAATANRDGAAVPGGLLPGLALGGAKATVSVRPEDIALVDPVAAPMRGSVTFIRDLGATIEIFIDCGGTEVIAIETPRNRRDLRVGQDVGVMIAPEHCVVLRS
ncbi:MAG: TOBE domain-containing protein, partial [Bauldia sp.]|nr:TOBE domain-containing protein [Bauldia sp.]